MPDTIPGMKKCPKHSGYQYVAANTMCPLCECETRVGWWYATGPADKEYKAESPEWNLHTVVSDDAPYPEHVMVENASGQLFAVPNSLIDDIASPPVKTRDE
jgi:hypothetical protein